MTMNQSSTSNKRPQCHRSHANPETLVGVGHPGTDMGAKASACLGRVKRAFTLTFVLACVVMLMMYFTSGRFERFTVVTTIPRRNGSNGITVVRSGLGSLNISAMLQEARTKRPIANGLRGVERVTSVNSDANGIESVTIVQSEASGGLVKGSNSSDPGLRIVKVAGSIEFPGMPDPCAEPRRRTGVEDLLCMERPSFLPDYKNPCWVDKRGAFRCLPYFHLFGVCKSGTSDLFTRLHMHPEIEPNKGIFGKEIWYWSWNRLIRHKKAGVTKLGMTLKEFTDKFYADKIRKNVSPNGSHDLITGHGDPMDFWDRFAEENTPQNTPGAEELLWTTPYSVRHINPGVKLLLMLRDPVERLYSHYFHMSAGTSARSFDEHIRHSIPLWKACLEQHTVRSCIYNPALRKQFKAPIHTSFYSVHLKEWLKVFPRSQMFIFRNEDYTKNMGSTLTSLFEFLNVSKPSAPLLDKMVKRSPFYATQKKKKAGPMMESTKKLLVDLYRPYMEELGKMLNDKRFAFTDQSFS